MDLNDGKFQQNGRSGYILKPRIQREGLTQTHKHTHTHTQSSLPPSLPPSLSF